MIVFIDVVKEKICPNHSTKCEATHPFYPSLNVASIDLPLLHQMETHSSALE
jgi:hypothetical protein